MNDRNWEEEAQRLFEDKFLGLCRALGQAPSPSGLRIAPPLALEEAKFFLLGLEAELFSFDAGGHVQSPLLSQASVESGMFLSSPTPRLFRESVCQLATAAELILGRGWPPRQIEIERASAADDLSACAVDILVKSSAGEILAAVEIKRSPQELAKLRIDFGQCCKRGTHNEANCGFPQNHAKYEFCAVHKPDYFWATAPGEDICFKLRYAQGGIIELQEIPTLPPRSRIELQHTSD